MDIESTAVSIGKAAEFLGWSKDTLRRWADAGLLPSDAVELSPGGHRRFRIEIIRAWAQARARNLVNKENQGKFQRISESNTEINHDNNRIERRL